MAITYSSPLFSFLQLSESDPTCSSSERPCLPVKELNDLAFQMIASVTGADKATFYDTVFINAAISFDCKASLLTEENWTGTWFKTTIGAGSEPDIWVGNFVYNTGAIWSLIDINQCFGIILYAEGGAEVACFDTCFKKITDDCYTSVIGYRNNENAFDFDYSESTFFNRVRLPLYLHSPTNSEEQKTYSKSNGSSVKLMHRIWKDYRVKTDYFTDGMLERFAVATAHDGVYITCSYSDLSNAQFIRTEKVEIDWQEENIPVFNLAQGKTTLRLASPRANINSNCA